MEVHLCMEYEYSDNLFSLESYILGPCVFRTDRTIDEIGIVDLPQTVYNLFVIYKRL